MFNIIGDGDGRYRIMLGDEVTVGWLTDRVVGFRGMGAEVVAREAAVVAWQAMHGVLTNHYAGWPQREPRFNELRITHDGAHEWFHDGVAPIARLIRPHRRAFNATFGIELVLPTYATEGVAIAVGQAVARAVVPLITGAVHADRPGTRFVDAIDVAVG